MKRPDTDIFESIVIRQKDRLFRFAYIRIGHRETAEDLVQDVLLKLYGKLSEETTIDDPERYLLRSISNACMDYYRRKRPEYESIDNIVEFADEADKDITEEFIRISKLLDGLPFEQAETLRMKCYDGLTFGQIADLQGIPEATVKSRYRYAIAQIRKKLNQ